jgi:predicted N-acyltransferase
MENGLLAKVGLENLFDYYPIYSKSMKELGTPTLGSDFFTSIAAHFNGDLNLITLTHQNQIIGGGFVFPYNNTVNCLWSGLLQAYYSLNSSYLLHWSVFRLAAQAGYQFVDTGRCKKNSGGHEFKRGFGGQEQQLYQQIYLNGLNHAPSVGAQKKEDIRYQVFTKVWHLLPLQATELLGPILRRQMPFG